MATTHRSLTTGILIVGFVATQWSSTLFAQEPSPSRESSAPSVVNSTSEAQEGAAALAAASTSEQDLSARALSPSAAEHFRATLNQEDGRLDTTRTAVWNSTRSTLLQPTLAQRGYYGRPGRGRHHGAVAAIAFGAAASIVGGAVLFYANRPDCNATPTPGGCSYGTKVAGGAVLSAGIAGLVVGALTWR